MNWVKNKVRKMWSRSEEHTSELQSRETISYAVFCLKKKKTNNKKTKEEKKQKNKHSAQATLIIVNNLTLRALSGKVISELMTQFVIEFLCQASNRTSFLWGNQSGLWLSGTGLLLLEGDLLVLLLITAIWLVGFLSAGGLQQSTCTTSCGITFYQEMFTNRSTH